MAAQALFVSVETTLDAAKWTARLTEMARQAGVPVFTEVFRALAGITVPAGPRPSGGPGADFELADHSPYLFLGGRITLRVA